MPALRLPPGTTLPARVLGTLQIVRVKRVRDGQFGVCLDCGAILEQGPTKAWTYRSSQWLHERGTGHKTVPATLVPIEETA